jgi:drug/metabolite transporter (DMT)-like permease
MIAMSLNKASTVSLLLNFEIVFTALIACFIFKEKIGLRFTIGLFAIMLGGISLSWTTNFSASWSLLLGIGASLFWAIDANLAARIANSESMQIARIRGLAAGLFNCCLALILGHHLPELNILGYAAITGIVSYGISLSLFITAMRLIGAARAMAYFSTEPFIGALLSVAILHEPLTLNLAMAGIFMGIGVCLHLTEKH